MEPTYFIVIDDQDWRAKGVLLVALDDDEVEHRAQYDKAPEPERFVDSFYIKAEDVGRSVVHVQTMDSEWVDVKKEHRLDAGVCQVQQRNDRERLEHMASQGPPTRGGMARGGMARGGGPVRFSSARPGSVTGDWALGGQSGWAVRSQGAQARGFLNPEDSGDEDDVMGEGGSSGDLGGAGDDASDVDEVGEAFSSAMDLDD